MATEKHVAGAIARIPLKAMAHCWRLPGAASLGYVALDLYYISWLKIASPAGRPARACLHFPSGNIAACWQITVLLPYLPPLYSLDYGTWGILKPKGNATAHPKMSALKWAIGQFRAAKVGPCCGEIASHSDWAKRKSSPLAAVIATTVVLKLLSLPIIINHFLGLELCNSKIMKKIC
jgi:hypothetical protein